MVIAVVKVILILFRIYLILFISQYGVPPQETPVTASAAIGSFILEFGYLSYVTGDPKYRGEEEHLLNVFF